MRRRSEVFAEERDHRLECLAGALGLVVEVVVRYVFEDNEFLVLRCGAFDDLVTVTVGAEGTLLVTDDDEQRLGE